MLLSRRLAGGLLAALALAPSTALAVPVTLDFRGGEVIPDPTAPGDVLYLEEGFAIRADGVYATDEEEAELFGFRPPYGLEAALPNFASTSATGIELEVYDYTIARADGGPFALDAFRSDAADFNSIAYTYELEDGRTLSERIYGEVAFYRFLGTRADGSTLATVSDADLATGLDLSGIVRLDVDWTEGPSGFRAECDPRNLRARDPELAALGAPEACGLDVPTAPGVARITAAQDPEDFLNFSNRDRAARVRAVEFTVPPTPVPLPASLPLLAGALAAARIARRRRR